MKQKTVLIAGCGDLGTEVGLRFSALGYRVVGLRRSVGLLPAPIDGQSIDLSVDKPLIPADTDIVVVAIAASRPTVDAYRSAYLSALRNLLDALDESGVRPRRMLLVSSTAVYDIDDGSWVDETIPAAADQGTAAILLEAERELHARRPDGVVFRLSGIYGPGRERLISLVRGGTATVSPGRRFTNRIHRDDAAAAIVHLMDRSEQPAPLYVGVDNEPVPLNDVQNFLAYELGVPQPSTPGVDSTRGGDKRLSNSLLRSTGFTFTYPNYRVGYRALLAGGSARHP